MPGKKSYQYLQTVNEKYTGNMMLPKYYAEDTHPSIISQSNFDKVERLFADCTKDTDFKRYDYDFSNTY